MQFKVPAYHVHTFLSSDRYYLMSQNKVEKDFGGDSAMDKIANYRGIVKEVISQYSRFVPSHGNIRLDTVFDETQDRYALMQVGWNRERRLEVI